ncbi:hypothetical protein R1flu_013669 [Riccia fluitans]|uniref:Uncharacterized protein n=1 Tax=Riccia fluitans TaxID=41844 RepID=A0ABD1YDY2_9MARC
MSKRRKLFSDEASSSALKVYLPLDREEASTSTVQVYQPLAREEASTSAVQPTRSSIGTTSECIVDLSAAGLRKLVDFLVKEECRRIVPPLEVEVEFLKQTGRKYKKDAWQDIAPWFGFSLTHSKPRSEGWVMDDFKKYSLEGHPDGYALDKQVRLVINQVQRMVGWESIVRIVTTDFLAKQATARHEPLLLEARNAFTNTKAEWDNEKGELVREREALKEELNKAKEMATKAQQHMEVVRLEKETLQQQYAKDKGEWERKNTQLIEEVGQLHEEKKRNAAREG